MTSTHTLKFLKISACMVLAIGLTTSAFASCGDSLSALAAAATSPVGQSRPTQSEASPATAGTASPSIVGLWHIQFTIGGNTIQEAYQLWNAGGTEVHNPNVDPRAGNVCLGVWKYEAATGTYKLVHRVWNYDTNGNFMGTINLTEKITVGKGGHTHSGSFTLDFYDPTGAFLTEVTGLARGDRVAVN
jgi:hypothetical protein